MRNARRSQSQLIAIGQDAPWVIASRLSALSRAASAPSARDVGELHRMVEEKWLALGDGWWQMAAQWWQWQAGWWLRPQPWLGPMGDDPLRWWQESMRAGDAVLASGLRPVARTVARNRRRLAGRN